MLGWKSLQMLYDKERNDKFLGRAIWEYETWEDWSSALEKSSSNSSNMKICGKPFRVAPCFEKENSNTNAPSWAGGWNKSNRSEMHQVFVKFLPYDATEKCIKEHIEKEVKGVVLDVWNIKICKEKQTGQSRGIGFLYFKEKEVAADAIEKLDGLAFWDKHIEVSWAIR